MANNYLQFSTIIPTFSKEQQDWIAAKFDEAAESDEGSICSYVPEEGGVWVYAEESGDVERIADLVGEFQTHFSIAEPWILTWAETCSEPRLDEFSGGAVAVFNGEQEWVLPYQRCEAWITGKRAIK